MKYIFFLASLLLLTFTIKPDTDFKNDQKSKIMVILKKDDPSLWDSTPIRAIRHLGYFCFTLIGCCNCLYAVGGPIVEPKHAPEIFVGSLVAVLLNFGVAHLIKVKSKEPEIAQIITDEDNKNNIVVIRQ